MQKPIAIIQGEPNSISSEIILKLWKKRKTFKHRNFFIIGNYNLLLKHKKFFKMNCKIKKIDKNFKIRDLYSSSIPILNFKLIKKKFLKKFQRNLTILFLLAFK